MASTTETSTSLHHGVDQIVDEVESGLELGGGGAGRVGDDLTASDVQKSFHGEVLSGRLVADAGRESGVDDIDPVVDRGNHLLLDLGSTDIDLVSGSDGKPTTSGEKLKKRRSEGMRQNLHTSLKTLAIDPMRFFRSSLASVMHSQVALRVAGMVWAQSPENLASQLARTLQCPLRNPTNGLARQARVEEARCGLRSPQNERRDWIRMWSEMEEMLKTGDQTSRDQGHLHRVLVLERSFLKVRNLWNSGKVRNLLLQAVRGFTGDGL